MDIIDEINQLFEKEIPKGISSKITKDGDYVLIHENKHQPFEGDEAAEELKIICSTLKTHSYGYHVLKSPDPDNYKAQYQLYVRGKISEITIELKKIFEKENVDVEDKIIKAIDGAISKGFDINKEIFDDAGYNSPFLRHLLNELYLKGCDFVDYAKIYAYLVEKGADIKRYGGEIIFKLLAYGPGYRYTWPCAKFLIGAGADINYKDYSTPFQQVVKACGNGERDDEKYKLCYEAFDYMLEKGGDPNIGDWNCLMIAAGTGNIYIVKQLLKHGADKNLKIKDGSRAVNFAKNDAIKKLLS